MKEFLALLAQHAAKNAPESLQVQLIKGLREAQKEWDDVMSNIDGLNEAMDDLEREVQ